MSKAKIKTIMKEHLGDNPSLDNMIDHIYESHLTCGNSLTAYELRYEFKKRKETESCKSNKSIILDISIDYNIPFTTAWRYITQ